MIGHVSGEGNARAFSDYLYVHGIENEVEAEKDGSWVIWIREEEELDRAKNLLAEFQQNPADTKYHSTRQAAEEKKEEKKREQARYEKRMKDSRQIFRHRTNYGLGPVTSVLMAFSVMVFILSRFGDNFRPIYSLFITEYVPGVSGFHGLIELTQRISHLKDYLPEIFTGQVWRLFTPMFIHFGFLHIFFNMLWLWDLGTMVETRQNSLLLAIFVLIIAASSNVAQFLMGGPLFGGMSGVNYGLAGYIWMRGKHDPNSGLYLHPTTVAILLIWFFAGVVGLVQPMANTCHGAGLLTGMAWGYLSAILRRR